ASKTEVSMRLFLALSLLLLPNGAGALSIQTGEAEVLTREQAVLECRDIGHGDACDRALAAGDTLERETFEACLTFKSEEDEARMDDDTPQYLRHRGFSRYGSCLRAVKNH